MSFQDIVGTQPKDMAPKSLLQISCAGLSRAVKPWALRNGIETQISHGIPAFPKLAAFCNCDINTQDFFHKRPFQ